MFFFKYINIQNPKFFHQEHMHGKIVLFIKIFHGNMQKSMLYYLRCRAIY